MPGNTANLRKAAGARTAALRQALEQAHGKNLLLRRRLAAAPGPGKQPGSRPQP
jgi:hypothetical protein